MGRRAKPVKVVTKGYPDPLLFARSFRPFLLDRLKELEFDGGVGAQQRRSRYRSLLDLFDRIEAAQTVKRRE